MSVDNSTILAAAYLHGTTDYQQRVPKVTQAGVSGVQEFLFSPMNLRFLNQFSEFLVNRIASHYIRQKAYENPLAFLKNERIPFGQTVEETAFKWLKAHSFNSDDMATETLLRTHYPEGVSAFHSVNRQDVYEVSHNYTQLRQAFTTETGLNDYIGAILQLPYNSAAYDELQIMKNLFAEYDKHHGMFRVKIDEPTDEASARAVLRVLREYADLLRFPSTVYNAQDVCGVPCWTEPESLCLFIEPKVRSYLDVEALAPLFNVTYAEVPYRVVVVDNIPIDDVSMVLAPRDFFMINDTVFETRTFDNPHSLTTNVYLHAWGIYSVSPFVPVIGFSTKEEVEIPVITQTVTGIEAIVPEVIYLNDKDSDDVARVNLLGTLDGTEDVCLCDVGVRPDAAVWEVIKVEGPDGELAFTAGQISIFDNGEIHVQAHGNSALAKAVKAGGVTVTCKVIATYINPDDIKQTFETEASFEVKCKEED